MYEGVYEIPVYTVCMRGSWRYAAMTARYPSARASLGPPVRPLHPAPRAIDLEAEMALNALLGAALAEARGYGNLEQPLHHLAEWARRQARRVLLQAGEDAQE